MTGLEPATSGVTGRRSNRLSYTRVFGVAGHLRGGLGGVNHRRLYFLALFDFFLIRLAGMGQSSVLKQKSGNVRRSGRGEDRLHND